MPKRKKKGTKTMGTGGNGSEGPATPSLGPKLGPPTVPIDQVYGMMQELEAAHRILDALGAPQGPLPDRMVWRARDWLRRVGPGSQTRIGLEARKIIKAAGQPLSQYPVPERKAVRKSQGFD